MYLEDILSAGHVTSLPEVTHKKRSKEATDQPSSWGADTVSISPEARAAQQAAAAQKEQQEKEQQEKEKQDNAASASFSEYMKSARGEKSSSGTDIKKLQNQLKNLQSQLAQVATSETIPEAVKTSKIESLNSQIASVMEQISGLSEQAAEGQSTEEA